MPPIIDWERLVLKEAIIVDAITIPTALLEQSSILVCHDLSLSVRKMYYRILNERGFSVVFLKNDSSAIVGIF